MARIRGRDNRAVRKDHGTHRPSARHTAAGFDRRFREERVTSVHAMGELAHGIDRLEREWSREHAAERLFAQAKLDRRKVQACDEDLLLPTERTEELEAKAAEWSQQMANARLKRDRTQNVWLGSPKGKGRCRLQLS